MFCTGEPSPSPKSSYVSNVFPEAYYKVRRDQRRALRRAIQQKERHRMAHQREEEKQYRNEVKEEVMGKMEYLRAEKERLRAEERKAERPKEEDASQAITPRERLQVQQ